MNGIIINIDPVLLRVGHFELRWYSLILILAMVAAVLISAREARRKGIAAEEIYSLAPWVLLGGIAGARLFHVIDQWEFYAYRPLQIVMLQQGGLAIWGGLVGGGVAVLFYAWARRIPLGRLADTLIPGLLSAQIIGRLACIINGDAYGGATSLPWGFIYIHPDAMIPASLVGVPTHPYPLYEMLWHGLVLFLLLRARRNLTRDGLLFLGYVSLYSVGRFMLTFVRQENTFFWGLQQAQILALALLLGSVAFLIYLWRRTGNTMVVGRG